MKEIESYAGENIKKVHERLTRYQEENNEVCFCMFNEKKLLSTDTLDECYVKVTGLTLEEFNKRVEEENEKYRKEEEEFKSKIPNLTEEYRKKARGIIPEDKLEKWDKIVPIRLNDLYHGMELDCWLDLIDILNQEDMSEENRFKSCLKLFDKQGHSGMSAGLVMSGLKYFHKDGNRLVDYINKHY